MGAHRRPSLPDPHTPPLRSRIPDPSIVLVVPPRPLSGLPTLLCKVVACWHRYDKDLYLCQHDNTVLSHGLNAKKPPQGGLQITRSRSSQTVLGHLWGVVFVAAFRAGLRHATRPRTHLNRNAQAFTLSSRLPPGGSQ